MCLTSVCELNRQTLSPCVNKVLNVFLSQLLCAAPQQTWRREAASCKPALGSLRVNFKTKSIFTQRVLFGYLAANMEPTLFPEEVSERKVCVVGSELVENYTVSCLPAHFAPVSLACSYVTSLTAVQNDSAVK